MNRTESIRFILHHKAVAVLRFDDPDCFKPLIEALYKGGIRVAEITMTVPGAIGLLEESASFLPDDMLLGVGSVIDKETAERAITAGAEFVVSPIVKEEVIRASRNRDKVVMAGAFTPTEIQHAWELGSDIVKVFPANILGLDFFKAVKAPLPHLQLMPTGGVSLTNGRDWLKAGACAVGIGSALVSSEDLRNKNYTSVQKKAAILVHNLKNREDHHE
ncbi:MAG: bifunctional 4-hydroxy-2-oxoglutarate aldolase/2-dehydro-3-deoxy-phosphogluconate aldolase [Balneolaceae bacterium]|nr:MAG: bifunctional 4-hydroxy-2-oxoglutarate aldolase/2-dehydro-3-deoxy-phosphogluconate aldolase [Balneolaceae bacterium]